MDVFNSCITIPIMEIMLRILHARRLARVTPADNANILIKYYCKIELAGRPGLFSVWFMADVLCP